MTSLVDALEVSFRIVDEKTVQITSRQEAAAAAEVEFYPLAELLPAGANNGNIDQLMRHIQARIAPDTWAGANPKNTGRLHFDKPSRCLIVLQSQPVQIQVENYLATERAKLAAKGEESK